MAFFIPNYDFLNSMYKSIQCIKKDIIYPFDRIIPDIFSNTIQLTIRTDYAIYECIRFRSYIQGYYFYAASGGELTPILD